MVPVHRGIYIHTYIPTYLPTYLRTYIHTITLHYLTLHYLTLHYLTLPYIPYIHTYIHTYQHTNIPTYQHTTQHTNIPPPQGTRRTIPPPQATGGGPEEPYHHHRPRGGGPEEPDDTVHPYPLVGGEGGWPTLHHIYIYTWDNPRIWDFLTKVTKLLSNAPQKYVILILSFKWCSAIRFLTTPTADIIFSV